MRPKACVRSWRSGRRGSWGVESEWDRRVGELRTPTCGIQRRSGCRQAPRQHSDQRGAIVLHTIELQAMIHPMPRAASPVNAEAALRLDNQLCFALYSASLAMTKL